jgi:hypothetical protein
MLRWTNNLFRMRKSTRTHDEEEAAAQAVQRVIGGAWVVTDTGTRPSEVDVMIDLEDGGRVAVEVTSRVDYEVRAARSAIRKRDDRGDFAGESLSCMWHVSVSPQTRISELRLVELEATLRDFEAQGLESVSAWRAHERHGDRAGRELRRLGIESAVRWNESPPRGTPRILFGQSFSVIGEHTSLPVALEQVLGQTDNQDKLAAVEADERHLYVLMHDRAAASGLRGVWPLSVCPPDPCGVIDMVWIFAPWASSAYLHRVVPGTDQWEHFVMATGEPAPDALSDA